MSKEISLSDATQKVQDAQDKIKFILNDLEKEIGRPVKEMELTVYESPGGMVWSKVKITVEL